MRSSNPQEIAEKIAKTVNSEWAKCELVRKNSYDLEFTEELDTYECYQIGLLIGKIVGEDRGKHNLITELFEGATD